MHILAGNYYKIMSDTNNQTLELLQEKARIQLKHLYELDELIEQLQRTNEKAIASFSGKNEPDLSNLNK